MNSVRVSPIADGFEITVEGLAGDRVPVTVPVGRYFKTENVVAIDSGDENHANGLRTRVCDLKVDGVNRMAPPGNEQNPYEGTLTIFYSENATIASKQSFMVDQYVDNFTFTVDFIYTSEFKMKLMG